jgi:hypothetical protein
MQYTCDSVSEKYLSRVFILKSRRPINTAVLRVSEFDSRVPAKERETCAMYWPVMERRGRVSRLLLHVRGVLG